MKKTILITGSTDGIGFLSAKRFLEEGHEVIIHGRNEQKVLECKKLLGNKVESFVADLSNFDEAKNFAEQIKKKLIKIDVLINNAGIYKTVNTRTKDNLDVRFAVNTIAPYILINELIDILDEGSRVINLSSAAQAPVLKEALLGSVILSDSEAYAQSKLALTMCSNYLAKKFENKIESIVAINPASFLGSKMVKEAYGTSGKDINIGVNILYKASLLPEFTSSNGKYYDNDVSSFSQPHNDALNNQKCEELISTIESILNK